jgi:hypothetical protein
MNLCKVIERDGRLTCSVCGLPFDGPYAITPADLAAIGGNLKRIYRPCALAPGDPPGGRTAREAPPRSSPSPSMGEGSSRSEPGEGVRRRKPKRDITTCVHRGDTLRAERCPTCCGTVEIKIFACAQFGQCALSDRLPAIPFCGACERFEAAEAVRHQP